MQNFNLMDLLTPAEKAERQHGLNNLSDYVDLKTAAAAVGRHPRTVLRWVNSNDPRLVFSRMGTQKNAAIIIYLPSLVNLYRSMGRLAAQYDPEKVE